MFAVVLKKYIFLRSFTILSLSLAIFSIVSNGIVAESYDEFIKNINDGFEKGVNKKKTIGRFDDGSDFDFTQTLYVNYGKFAEDRYKKGDFIDAYYFKTKAEKIRRYKIISPANPYSFGILPDDMEQFIIAREQLRNVSINSILNSNDGLVLADSYIAFDCWLEAFEEGNSQDRLKRCRDRFLDNMKAMRVSLLMQGYNIFDMSSKENLAYNNRYSNCESCILYDKGQYCNTIYFDIDEARMMDKMNVVIKRIEQKLSFFNSPTVLILYYPNAYGFKKKLSDKRLDVVKNLVYNMIARDLPIKPIVKLTQIRLNKKLTDKKIYRDAITVCVSGNE